jgi:adenylate cyclase
MERERKFLVKKPPHNYDSYESAHIEQFYLCYNPEIRMRKADDKYYLTIKSNGTFMRKEFEIRMLKIFYYWLRKHYEQTLIFKDRYYIPITNNHTAELDIYLEELKGLIICEVEFKHKKDLVAFAIPNWFEKEVTKDLEYRNKTLSKRKGDYYEKA